jgi:transposase
MVDALGNPVDFKITGGEVSDITQAKGLLEGKKGAYVVADKAYDSNDLINSVKEKGVVPVIPSRTCRKESRGYDNHIYKDRNLIERFFNKLKQFRRIATRYEKTIVSFIAMVKLGASLILLR